ncbi:MAG: zinc-ribbon domain-containing protein [Candidatus Thermoplasmatota archaeon]|nr:zinc-ribbon domain-containing protein [Candidatus Thermoplasmatota archaeon]
MKTCERYGCGGRMLCPICGGNDLGTRREKVSDPYDFANEKIYRKKNSASDYEARYFAEQKQKKKEAERARPPSPGPSISRHCPLCGYPLQSDWKFCPECGVSQIRK